MNSGNSFWNRLENWQKGFLVVVVGVPSSILAISLITSIILPATSQPIVLLGLGVFLIIFGLVGGFLAKNEFFKTFIFSIMAIFLFVVVITFLLVLSGTGIFSLSQSSDPAGSFFVVLMLAIIFASIVSIFCSIFLLPSLAIGFLINRSISSEIKSTDLVENK